MSLHSNQILTKSDNKTKPATPVQPFQGYNQGYISTSKGVLI